MLGPTILALALFKAAGADAHFYIGGGSPLQSMMMRDQLSMDDMNMRQMPMREQQMRPSPFEGLFSRMRPSPFDGLFSSIFSQLMEGDDDDFTDDAMSTTVALTDVPSARPFDLFFSDDGAAVLVPRPPQQVATFSFFSPSDAPRSFLRGGSSAGGFEDEGSMSEDDMPCMACAADLEHLCGKELESTTNDDGMVASFVQQMCLMRHERFLTKRCATFLGAQEANLVSQCFRDIEAQCAGVQPGNHAVHDCLTDHAAGLSEGCKTQLRTSSRMRGDEAPFDLVELPASEDNQRGSVMGDLSSLFEVFGGLFTPSATSPYAKEEEEKEAGSGLIGANPSTWTPKSEDEDGSASAPGLIGGNPLTWTPKSEDEDGSASAPGLIGGNPLTWTPKSEDEDGSASTPGLIGGNPLTWTPKGPERAEPGAEGSGTGLASSIAAAMRSGSTKLSVWGGGSDGDISPAPVARGEAAMAAQGLGTAAVQPVDAQGDRWSETLATAASAAVVAVGAAGLLVAAAVANRANRRRVARAREAEWNRSFAPALLG